MNIVLDLDQTLISAEATEDFDYDKNQKKAGKFTFHNMDDYYVVFERPHLQDFLSFLFKHFKVSIWTAASKDYALFVIDKIIIGNNNNRHIEWVFYDTHCNIAKKLNKKGHKNLTLLWGEFEIKEMNRQNTIILDDLKDVYTYQEGNCVAVPEFNYKDEDSPRDDFLLKLKDSMINIKPQESPSSQIKV